MVSLKQNRFVWVIKTCFSQNTNQLTTSYCPLNPQGNVTQKAFCWPHGCCSLLVGGPQSAGNRCGTVVLQGELQSHPVLMWHWAASENRPGVRASGHKQPMDFSVTWCLWLLFLLLHIADALSRCSGIAADAHRAYGDPSPAPWWWQSHISFQSTSTPTSLGLLPLPSTVCRTSWALGSSCSHWSQKNPEMEKKTQTPLPGKPSTSLPNVSV